MGAGGFHGRVRDGIGWSLPAMATRSSSRHVVCWVGFGVVAGSGVCVAVWALGAQCDHTREWMAAAHDDVGGLSSLSGD